MKKFSLFFISIIISLSAFSDFVLDLKSGEYIDIPREVLQAKKEKEAKEKWERKKEQALKELQLVLPEDKVSKEEWAEEIKKNPWKEWKLYKNLVTNDFVNTTSNVLVITFLDYEGAAKDGIDNINVIREKYKLCCVLHPGDKYVETHDGQNGVRLASYLQVNKFCDEAKQYYGFKCMDKDWDGDGLSAWDEVKGTNIVVKYKNCSSNLFVVTFDGSKDTDRDGINDNDEISGKNGFVTDPSNPDTDGDGIPDGSDKFPTYSCESKDPKFMPEEWAEYWSKQGKFSYDKLILADADPDGDGFTNRDEKLLGLDPNMPDRDFIIISPSEKFLNNVKKNTYVGYFNFLVNTNILTTVQIVTYDWDDSLFGRPEIKYMGSFPLHEKVFKDEYLFRMSSRDRESHSFFARVQPMAIHRFKVTCVRKGIFHKRFINSSSFSVTIGCMNHRARENDRTFKQFPYGTADFRVHYSKFMELPPPKKIPKLISPVRDQYFINEEKIPCEWETEENPVYTEGSDEYNWRSSSDLQSVPTHEVFLDAACKNYPYDVKFSYGYPYERLKSSEVLHFPREEVFSTYAIGCCITGLNDVRLLSEYTPVFKTRRLTLDSTFVFKPASLREIRLQAKYGKKNYQRILEERKKYEDK